MKTETCTETETSLGQPITAFTLPRLLLDLPLQNCQAQNSDSPFNDSAGTAGDFAQSLQVALTAYLGKYPPDIQLTADITGQSVRTLQRRLARRGVTFRETLDEIRLQRAMRLIEDDDVRLGDIALEVGYSDSAHFNRAFHRWTGISPSKYRLQQSADR